MTKQQYHYVHKPHAYVTTVSYNCDLSEKYHKSDRVHIEIVHWILKCRIHFLEFKKNIV